MMGHQGGLSSLLSQPVFERLFGISSTYIDEIINFLVFRDNDWSLDNAKYREVASVTVKGPDIDFDSYITRTHLIFWQLSQPEMITSNEYEYDTALSQKLTNLFKGNTIRVFKNSNIKNTVVVYKQGLNLEHVDNIGIIAASIPLLLPWLKITNADKPIFKKIFEHEFTVIDMLADSIPKPVIDQANEQYIDELLGNVKNSSKMRVIKRLDKQYETLINEIERFRDAINTKQAELNDVITQRMAIELHDDSSEDITQFFKQHKSIVKIVSVDTYSSECRIKYSVTTPFQFYDAEALERIMSSANSWYNKVCLPWQQKLIKDIFIDNKVQMMANGTFTLCEFADVRPQTYENNSISPSTPNPHIYFYGCLGGNQEYFNQFAQKGEWQLAIEQSIGCVANLNFCDVSVMSRFIECLKQQRKDKVKTLRYEGEAMDIDTYLEISAIDSAIGG